MTVSVLSQKCLVEGNMPDFVLKLFTIWNSILTLYSINERALRLIRELSNSIGELSTSTSTSTW